MLKRGNRWFPCSIRAFALKERPLQLPRKKGQTNPYSRKEVLQPVRLTASEKRQVRRNATDAGLSVAGFVRARILPEVQAAEDLQDAKPGKPVAQKRSRLTTALNRIGLNLEQVATYVDLLSDLETRDRFDALQRSVRGVLRDHLASTTTAVRAREKFAADLDDNGRSLNRITRSAHTAGEIAKPDRFRDLIVELEALIVELARAGEGKA